MQTTELLLLKFPHCTTQFFCSEVAYSGGRKLLKPANIEQAFRFAGKINMTPIRTF